MRSWALFLVLALGLAAIGLAVEPADRTSPPAALEDLYPPKAPAPVYMLKMLEVDHALSGFMVNLFEQDLANAAAALEQFQQHYAEVAKLVPEWEHYFDVNAARELGEAMTSGDQGRVMGAVQKVGATCNACHVDNMAAVQQKYGWDDFSQIGATDPVTGQSVNFAGLMQQVGMSFDGIETDLREGQADRAAKHYDDFAKRFKAMKETCSACHQTERKYYVDADIESLISQLGAAVKSPAPDAAAIEHLSEGIGMGSCHQCHLVHVPAATAQMRWQEAPKTAGK